MTVTKLLNRRLMEAAADGDTALVRELLDAGANPNTDNGYDTALSKAARSHRGNAATIRLLLQRGAYVNGNPKRRTINPLVRAAHQSDCERIRLLVEAGADVNCLEEKVPSPGHTPLQELVTWADVPTLMLLIERGADVNKKSAVSKSYLDNKLVGRKTALHLAAACGRADIVSFLLAHGADISAEDVQGLSAIDYALHQLDQPYFLNGEHEEEAQLLHDTIELLEKERNHAKVTDDPSR